MLTVVDQSVNVKFVGRRYTTRPGVPTVVSGKHNHKVHSCRFLNVPVLAMSWRLEGSVPGGWATVGETSFSKSS